jgi:adenine-specific DNA-methyltransferase
MVKKIDSLKHPADTRAHIPSHEEAGYEDENKKVKEGTKILETPKNPVVHRGQDPELFWLNKYDHDDREELLRIDIRSLYRHEHIAPETLIKNLYKVTEEKSPQLDMFSVNELFGNALEKDELDKVSEYYHHQDGWTNRLIQGDSLLTMGSLLEREGMAGQVQMIYFDPPYGIKYGSNWQIKLNNRDVKDGSDEALTGEPEQIKAFRDTWELGIHSYLSYMRDRLLIARELLTDSGSCFVQISDENVHLLRSVMDEVFGSENFIAIISFRKKTMPFGTNFIEQMADFVLWYGRNKLTNDGKPQTKYRKLTRPSNIEGEFHHCWYELPDGKRFRMTKEQIDNHDLLPKNARVYRLKSLEPSGKMDSGMFEFEFEGKKYTHPKNGYGTNFNGMLKLKEKNRLQAEGNRLTFVMYADESQSANLTVPWNDTVGADDKQYIVQTNSEVIKRCLLMTTDPGDLVLDPTCGSGTTAYVAEQFGRRWITIDTSRIAINIAKQRIMTAVFPYYKLYDETKGDIRQGFVYKTVPHITLKSLANDEPAQEETLYDQPLTDKSVLRVSGPFTVETLQNFEPVSPSELEEETLVTEEVGEWEEKIRQHLLSTGIKNGRKDERVDFTRVELLADAWLHAEGFYHTAKGEHKAYFHIGPRFGTVSKEAVNKAIVACRQRGDANWMVILGFSFESDIQGGEQTTSLGSFEVTKAKIHDDLLQEGLKKKPAKSAASFITIGEPDVALGSEERIVNGEKIRFATITIEGLDIYDPIKDEIKARNIHEIAYWMLDDDYDGSNFIVKQLFFCGGDKTEFDKWRRGLSDLSESRNRRKRELQDTLKIEIDEDAFERLYGHTSHPVEILKKEQKVAVRIVSMYGEETTKVISLF